MARTGKVIKSVATTALRAAAAAATAVVVEKMTDVIAEKVHALDKAGATPKKAKVAVKAKAKTRKAVRKKAAKPRRR